MTRSSNAPGAAAPGPDARVVELLERIAIAVETLVKSRAGDAAPDVLTAPELATLLRIDERTLRQMRHAGDVPRGFLCGRSPRWRRTQIEAWIAKVQR